MRDVVQSHEEIPSPVVKRKLTTIYRVTSSVACSPTSLGAQQKEILVLNKQQFLVCTHHHKQLRCIDA